jgi:DNA mismatch endonuclease (patch repair protein)
MTDRMSPQRRSSLMSRIRGKNTSPEIAVRRLAHSLGFRFRLHRRDLPGTPDLVFPRLRRAVLVHGCFWHHHQDPKCRNAVLPKTREEWWRAKLWANVARDARNLERLLAEGWTVLVLWECEVRSGAFEAKLAAFLEASDQLAMRHAARAAASVRYGPRSERRQAR